MNSELTKSVMPNFIVFGAPKSGTTSVYQYLKQHPDIYMSSIKEPGFFTFEGVKTSPFIGPGIQEWFDRQFIKDLDSYHKLFAGHSGEKAIGEATPFYIYDEKCAAAIYKRIPNVKLIAILRNPADRAFSSYVFAMSYGRENLPQFQDALAVESKRIKENWAPRWHYKNLGFYYRQLKPFYQKFAPEQIKICLYENLVTEPNLFMQDIFKFLEVDSNFTPDMSRQYNPSLIPRNEFLDEFLLKPNPIKLALKKILPSSFRKSLKRKVKHKNLYKPTFSPEIRQKLMKEYREDILKLQKLTRQDFSLWMS